MKTEETFGTVTHQLQPPWSPLLLSSHPDSPDTDNDPYDDNYINVNVTISQPHHRNRTITTDFQLDLIVV